MDAREEASHQTSRYAACGYRLPVHFMFQLGVTIASTAGQLGYLMVFGNLYVLKFSRPGVRRRLPLKLHRRYVTRATNFRVIGFGLSP